MALGAIRYNLIAGPDEVTVTGTSQTLAELGVILGSTILRLTLISTNLSGVSWANDKAAVDGVNPLPDLVMIEMEATRGTSEKLEFITDGTEIKVSVVQEG